jgi:chaperone BCS1
MFDSVILPQETKDKIVSHLDTFLKEREWYLKNGIPYRTGIILHGVPGTGKTSLVRGLCQYLGKPLYIINLNALTDGQLERAFGELPRGSVCLMEDIDTYSVTNTRVENDSGDDVGGAGEAIAKAMSGLTLAGLLNAVDGIIASDGRILIATTNHLEKLDAALVRKGRFNLTLEIGYLTDDCFRKFFANFYPNFPISPRTKFKEDMTPATLQALIIDNRYDPAYVLSQCVE